MIASVVDIGEQLIAGVNDTGQDTGIGAAWLSWGAAAQLVARRLAVRQARVRGRLFPLSLQSDEEMERDLGECRRINVLYECA